MADDKHEEQRKEAARQMADEHKQEARHPDAHRDARTSSVMGSQSRPTDRANIEAAVANREAPHGFGQSGAAPPTDTRQGDRGSKGRYRLLAPHVIAGYHLEAGAEVGEGTGYPVAGPSNQMEGIDDLGKSRVNELHQKLYGKDAPWHDPEHPIAQAQQDAEMAQAQRDEEAEQEPVSHQQAWERGYEEFQGQKLSGPPGGPLVSRTISGDTSQPMGPGTPRQDLADPDVQTRTAQPLKDSMPQEGAAGGGTQQPNKR
jgi:Ni/Co efflux regulator RcnB